MPRPELRTGHSLRGAITIDLLWDRRLLGRLSEARGIGNQGGAAFQRIRPVVPATTLSIPTRYVHTPNELAHKRDVEAAVQLLIEALPELGSRSYLA